VLLARLTLYGRGAERLHEVLISVAARWLDLDRRDGPLTPYARDAEQRALALLDDALSRGDRQRAVSEQIASRLLVTAPRDISDLREALTRRADEEAASAAELLSERGRREAEQLRATLSDQRKRVHDELVHSRAEFDQLTLDFAQDERRQLESNM